MKKQDIYKIVGDMENGFCVERKDEPYGNGMWWVTTVYTCEKKGEEGYEEAKQWIEEQDNIVDRIDDIRANSVTDEEFEKAHGMSLDEMTERMSKKWIDQYPE